MWLLPFEQISLVLTCHPQQTRNTQLIEYHSPTLWLEIRVSLASPFYPHPRSILQTPRFMGPIHLHYVILLVYLLIRPIHKKGSTYRLTSIIFLSETNINHTRITFLLSAQQSCSFLISYHSTCTVHKHSSFLILKGKTITTGTLVSSILFLTTQINKERLQVYLK